MEKQKFKIRPRKYTGESTILSMRIPKEMVRDIDQIAGQTGLTRNEFLMLSLEYALENLEIDEKE